jgi:hypothetical protein
MGVELLWTFVCRCIKQLCQREMTLWMYSGPSCLDLPFFVELDGTKINT